MIDTIHSISEHADRFRNDPEFVRNMRILFDGCRQAHGLDAITFQYELTLTQFGGSFNLLDGNWQRWFLTQGIGGGTFVEEKGVAWWFGKCAYCDRQLVVSLRMASVGATMQNGIPTDAGEFFKQGTGMACASCLFEANPLIDRSFFYQ